MAVEDEAELNGFQEGISQTNIISNQALLILNDLEERLGSLEYSMLPVHRTTQQMSRTLSSIFISQCK